MSAADEPERARGGEGEGERDAPSSDAPAARAPTDEVQARDEREAAERKVDDEEDPFLDEVDVRELLRGALQPPAAPSRDMLRGVQRRIRTRSRGKFYADGWSTARSPRSLYLSTSIFMLVLIAFVLIVLVPWGSSALP
ncbi:hypothetical protein [Chondromyces crocatus]|uniref:Uncharacterized protein n=1 Tax=Chondromyces crocatus TaxID=52 RepID=A0A0K1E5J2_CHOCO|nr:hypothetical protein [Chondromyces crocatus]AKT36140.1 uncharacterized protein CMC5_002530 [Chondromyces crocatus]